MSNLAERNNPQLSHWCDRAWMKCCWCIVALMLILIVVDWHSWDTKLKLLAAGTALIPVHATEEWFFPGGFGWQYNTFIYKSDVPDRFPMNRASDMVTVLFTTVMFAVMVIVFSLGGGAVPAGVLLGLMLFSLLEVAAHSFFGISAYLRFRDQGKTTIYGAGSASAYWGFATLAALCCVEMPWSALGGGDWLVCLTVLVAIAVFCFVPEAMFRNRNSPYAFHGNGYYERYL